MGTLSNRYLISMNKKELYLGGVCWALYLLPQILLPLLPIALTTMREVFLVNLTLFVFNFAVAVLLLRGFLFRSAAPLCRNGKQVCRSVLSGYLRYYGMFYVVTLLLMLIPMQPQNINQAGVDSFLQAYPAAMAICTVILAPVTEELLVRGVIFGPLCRKSPFLAYFVTTVLFAGMHVLDAIGQQSALETLLIFLRYVPGGLALGWVYQRTSNIFGPILLHMLINLILVVLTFLGVA